MKAARSKEPAALPAPLSSMAQAEAAAKASRAEAELLAMLDLEEVRAGGASGLSKGKTNLKSKCRGGNLKR